jgi:hypothetical protein
MGPSQQWEGEGEEKSGGVCADPGKKKWAEPVGTGEFFIYSNKIQINSNCFDQKVYLPISKNSKENTGGWCLR